jgi:hypothetical protein
MGSLGLTCDQVKINFPVGAKIHNTCRLAPLRPKIPKIVSGKKVLDELSLFQIVT